MFMNSFIIAPVRCLHRISLNTVPTRSPHLSWSRSLWLDVVWLFTSLRIGTQPGGSPPSSFTFINVTLDRYALAFVSSVTGALQSSTSAILMHDMKVRMPRGLVCHLWRSFRLCRWISSPHGYGIVLVLSFYWFHSCIGSNGSISRWDYSDSILSVRLTVYSFTGGLGSYWHICHVMVFDCWHGFSLCESSTNLKCVRSTISLINHTRHTIFVIMPSFEPHRLSTHPLQAWSKLFWWFACRITSILSNWRPAISLVSSLWCWASVGSATICLSKRMTPRRSQR